jgi:hypothetical protein
MKTSLFIHSATIPTLPQLSSWMAQNWWSFCDVLEVILNKPEFARERGAHHELD